MQLGLLMGCITILCAVFWSRIATPEYYAQYAVDMTLQISPLGATLSPCTCRPSRKPLCEQGGSCRPKST